MAEKAEIVDDIDLEDEEDAAKPLAKTADNQAAEADKVSSLLCGMGAFLKHLMRKRVSVSKLASAATHAISVASATASYANKKCDPEVAVDLAACLTCDQVQIVPPLACFC
jgi:hypothetical protein